MSGCWRVKGLNKGTARQVANAAASSSSSVNCNNTSRLAAQVVEAPPRDNTLSRGQQHHLRHFTHTKLRGTHTGGGGAAGSAMWQQPSSGNNQPTHTHNTLSRWSPGQQQPGAGQRYACIADRRVFTARP